MSVAPSLNDALLSLAPNSAWSHSGTYDSIVWHDQNDDQPTQSEVEEELERLVSEYERCEYARNRASEYPPIGDQLDALYHAGVFPEDMASQIAAVKAKYPKPE